MTRSLAGNLRPPTSVNDGYVTWVRTSVRWIPGTSAHSVVYREFKSGTAFHFTYEFTGE